MKRKKSIHDIAKELNVSATTISFVMNGKAEEKRISTEVKERIEKYIRKINYEPNVIAKSLRTGKSKILAMLVEDISDPFFSSIARNVEVGINKHHYKLFFASTENDTEKTKSLIKIFRDRQVDGFIIAPPPGIEKEVKELLKDHYPIVLFDRHFPELKSPTILIDNYDGARMAVDHLINNGFSKIAFVTLNSEQSQMQARLDGYYHALRTKKLPTFLLKVSYKDIEDVKQTKMAQFFKKQSKLDAIVFATNYLAIAGLQALKDLKLSVPGQRAVVGFDDNTHFSLFSPSVTAIAQPVEKIAAAIVDKMLLSLLGKQENAKPEPVLLAVSIVERESSRKSTVKMAI